MNEMNALFTRKFEQIVAQGARQAQTVIERIHTEIPDDRLARGRAMRFSFGPQPQPQLASVHALRPEELEADDPRAAGMDGADEVAQVLNMVDLGNEETQPPPETQPPARGPESLLLTIADRTDTVHRHALGQLAEWYRVHGHKVPVRWLRNLVRSPEPELRDIALEVLNRIAQHSENVADKRFLLRSVNGQTRAVLSDSYKRIDCRPILDMVCAHLERTGMNPLGGSATDTRINLRFAYPKVFQLRADESPILIGGVWTNSDFGRGANGLATWVERGFCLNGCSSKLTMKQTHSGSRLPTDIKLAADTLRADTEANKLVMRDQLQHVLGEDRVAEVIAALRIADSTRTSWDAFAPRLKKILGQGELTSAKKAFEGEDVVNLPSGQSHWRMSNAISWLAHSASPSRAMVLNRLAGSIAFGEKTLDTGEAA